MKRYSIADLIVTIPGIILIVLSIGIMLLMSFVFRHIIPNGNNLAGAACGLVFLVSSFWGLYRSANKRD